MNRQRRQQLIDKFPAINNPRPMEPALNTTVQAILDAERIDAGTHGRDNGPLFDPVWSPEMWKRANEAMCELRNAIAECSISVESHDHDFVDLDEIPDDAVAVWAVGGQTVHIGHPLHKTQRPTKRVDWFTGSIQFAQEIDDYWRYGNEDNPRYPADYELRCNVNIAADCTAPLSPDVNDYGGGTTRLMTVRRGQFLLLFRCCRVCEELAGKIADTNFKISVLEAQAKLPPGAVIDPGSPVPPRP